MYIRVGVYPIEETLALFPVIDREALKQQFGRKWQRGIEREIIDVDGYKVKAHSLRYQLFKEKGITCVECGVKGIFFALETTQDNLDVAKTLDREPTYHFNLYALREDGSEVLMTKDHILPVSRGGSNRIENLQVMCTTCNVKKMAILPPLFRHKCCCEVMNSHGHKLMGILNTTASFPPFQFCPWCKQKIVYVKKELTSNEESVRVCESKENEMEVVA